MFENIGEMLVLFWRTLVALPMAWRQRQKIFEHFFEIGNGSLLMVCVLAFFIGGETALQTGPFLAEKSFGGYLGGIVGYSVCRELAPILMAILIAGRSGSAMAAEIGSMRVYQEIDALRTMNINPIHYLILPRMVAIAIALPMLVLFAILVGWVGGGIVSAANNRIDIPIQAFFKNLSEIVKFRDVGNGLFKSFCFALIIGVVSCHQGLVTIGGPRGIGRSVTKAVVNSIVLIIVFDYILTRVLLK